MGVVVVVVVCFAGGPFLSMAVGPALPGSIGRQHLAARRAAAVPLLLLLLVGFVNPDIASPFFAQQGPSQRVVLSSPFFDILPTEGRLRLVRLGDRNTELHLLMQLLLLLALVQPRQKAALSLVQHVAGKERGFAVLPDVLGRHSSSPSTCCGGWRLALDRQLTARLLRLLIKRERRLRKVISERGRPLESLSHGRARKPSCSMGFMLLVRAVPTVVATTATARLARVREESVLMLGRLLVDGRVPGGRQVVVRPGEGVDCYKDILR